MRIEFGIRNSEFGMPALASPPSPIHRFARGGWGIIQNSEFRIPNLQPWYTL
jgi:hypothetical protein